MFHQQREPDWRMESRMYHDQARGVPNNYHERGVPSMYHDHNGVPGRYHDTGPHAGYPGHDQEMSFTSDHDHSGRYRSYKDSSGDQGI